MKKSPTRLLHSLILTVVFSLLLAPFSSLVVAPKTAKAEGEIEIDDCEELQLIGNDGQYPLNEDYILTQDIDCSLTNPANQDGEYAGSWQDGEGFDPIGDDINPFTGTFNGQGFQIVNLYINRPLESNLGLFGYADSATISKVNLYVPEITGDENVGSVVGYLNNNSTVSNSFRRGGAQQEAI